GYDLLLFFFGQDIAHAGEAKCPTAVNVLDQFSMAGFEVTLHGRFWVTPEGLCHHAKNRFIPPSSCGAQEI
ncbi:MAG: hypothetical protein LAP21_21500, partial [Acidobacteriia bacterium]|nr:hypothetical protein [Terriglobia bacterium]